MRKKISESIQAKTFLSMLALLVVCCVIIYGMVMVFLPRNYHSQLEGQVTSDFYDLVEELERNLSFFDTVVRAEQSISEPFIPISAQKRTVPPEPAEPPFSRFPQTSVRADRSALTQRPVRPPALVFVGLA